MDFALFFRDCAVTIIMYVLCIVLIYRYRTSKRIQPWHVVAAVFFCICMSAVACITGVTPLSGFHLKIRFSDINWNLFWALGDMLKQDPVYAFMNIAGNVVLFVPLGFFLPLLCRSNRSFVKVSLAGFGISFLIEFWQLFLLRGSDVMDLFLNTFGAMFGYSLFTGFYTVFPKFCELLSSNHKKYKKIEQTEIGIAIFLPVLVSVLLGFVDCIRYGLL